MKRWKGTDFLLLMNLDVSSSDQQAQAEKGL